MYNQSISKEVKMRRYTMKQFLSSKLCDVKQFLSSAFNKTKPFLLSAFGNVKQFLSSGFRSIKEHLNPRLSFLFALFLVLIIALTIGISKCSSNQVPADEVFNGVVTVESLDVHKKANPRSRVVAQLPLGFEVDIVEQQTAKETTWGRIEETTLDGQTIKSGWVDLQFIVSADSFIDEPDSTQDEPEPAPELPTVAVTMGTVTADKLNIRKGPDSKYETNGAYYKGDRVEIVETQTVDDTVWGRTNLGWIGMGYVRMDGSDNLDANNPFAANLITNGETTVLGYGVVNLRELNVRLGPGTDYDKVATVKQGTRYAYYQESDSAEKWVRIEGGWVSTEFFYLEGTVADNAMTGTVTTEDLNIRTGPATSFQSIGTCQLGETVDVLAQVDGWGYTENGWISMAYVKAFYPTGTGTINNGLNIRLEPNADAEIVGTYTTGDRVTILEVIDSWGRTDKGWINLKYITYD